LVVETDEDGVGLPKLHLPPESGACAYCNGSPLTDEHVWAQWVSGELSVYGGFVTQAEHGPRIRLKIDVIAPVCDSCNTGWLSVLENDVKPILAPMLHGRGSVSLSVDDQRLLATWAVKTALMIDLSGGSPIIPAGFYQEFRLRREPHEAQVVWLGAYSGSQHAIWADHHGLQLGAHEDESPRGFVTTFTAFRVLFQVVGCFNKGFATVDDRLMLGALHRIAPGGGEAIQWPRDNLAFGDDMLSSLAASVTD